VCTKLVELLLIRWLREETYNVYLRGELALKVLGEFLSFKSFFVFLSSS
jgi:hypothetical protein